MNYDANLWALLSRQLASDLSQVPRLNRAQLIDDAFELTSQGLLSLDILMNLTSYLTKEIDPFPWLTATRNYQHILDLLYNQTSHDLLQVSVHLQISYMIVLLVLAKLWFKIKTIWL